MSRKWRFWGAICYQRIFGGYH